MFIMKRYKTSGFPNYQSALRFKNKVMFDDRYSNPRLFKRESDGRWAVSYSKR